MQNAYDESIRWKKQTPCVSHGRSPSANYLEIKLTKFLLRFQFIYPVKISRYSKVAQPFTQSIHASFWITNLYIRNKFWILTLLTQFIARERETKREKQGLYNKVLSRTKSIWIIKSKLQCKLLYIFFYFPLLRGIRFTQVSVAHSSKLENIWWNKIWNIPSRGREINFRNSQNSRIARQWCMIHGHVSSRRAVNGMRYLRTAIAININLVIKLFDWDYRWLIQEAAVISLIPVAQISLKSEWRTALIMTVPAARRGSARRYVCTEDVECVCACFVMYGRR